MRKVILLVLLASFTLSCENNTEEELFVLSEVENSNVFELQEKRKKSKKKKSTKSSIYISYQKPNVTYPRRKQIFRTIYLNAGDLTRYAFVPLEAKAGYADLIEFYVTKKNGGTTKFRSKDRVNPYNVYTIMLPVGDYTVYAKSRMSGKKSSKISFKVIN